MGVAGQPARPRGLERLAVEVRVGHGLDDAADEVVAERADPDRVVGLVLDRQLDRGREAGDRRGVDGAAADVALLAAAVRQRGHVDLAAYDQRADAVGSADLVAGERERVDAGGREVDGDGTDGLHGVGVHRDAVLGGDRDDLLDRLEGADLVVGPHHRDQRDRRGVPLHGGPQRGDVQAGAGVDRQQLDPGLLALPQPVQRVEDRVVLDRGRQDAGPGGVGRPPGPVDALERQVVGLGATGGEHHLTRAAVQGLRDLLARLLHHPARPAPRGVQRAGVADVEQVLRHRLDGRGEHRRGGSVVEVDRGRQRHGRAKRTAVPMPRPNRDRCEVPQIIRSSQACSGCRRRTPSRSQSRCAGASSGQATARSRSSFVRPRRHL